MDRLTIIKVGGKVVENTESLNALLDQFIKFSGNKILVHGGGKLLPKLQQSWALKPKWWMDDASPANRCLMW
jgi:acetylglutamate kinase